MIYHVEPNVIGLDEGWWCIYTYIPLACKCKLLRIAFVYNDAFDTMQKWLDVSQ